MNHLIESRAPRKPRVRLDIDVREAICLTWRLTTKEIGRAWLDLLGGKQSELQGAVVRRVQYANQRRQPSKWRETRLRIFERDGWACVYCGSSESLHCDHVRAVSKGGSHDDSNLATACRSCNVSKRDRDVDEWRMARG